MPEHRVPEQQYEGLSPTCECGRQMTHLGDLPQSRGKPAIRIFRCYGCDNVVSAPKDRLHRQND
jgi:hypothetical protein